MSDVTIVSLVAIVALAIVAIVVVMKPDEVDLDGTGKKARIRRRR